jgi:hypothetical protein
MIGEHKPEPFLVTGFSESDGAFSPDGHFIAYVSDETGEPEVYVRSFPASAGGKWRISSGGGYQPRWRRDGKELFLCPEWRQIHERGRYYQSSIPRRHSQVSVSGRDLRRWRNHWQSLLGRRERRPVSREHR